MPTSGFNICGSQDQRAYNYQKHILCNALFGKGKLFDKKRICRFKFRFIVVESAQDAFLINMKTFLIYCRRALLLAGFQLGIQRGTQCILCANGWLYNLECDRFSPDSNGNGA
jgi:hypothetical protein